MKHEVTYLRKATVATRAAQQPIPNDVCGALVFTYWDTVEIMSYFCHGKRGGREGGEGERGREVGGREGGRGEGERAGGDLEKERAGERERGAGGRERD